MLCMLACPSHRETFRISPVLQACTWRNCGTGRGEIRACRPVKAHCAVRFRRAGQSMREAMAAHRRAGRPCGSNGFVRRDFGATERSIPGGFGLPDCFLPFDSVFRVALLWAAFLGAPFQALSRSYLSCNEPDSCRSTPLATLSPFRPPERNTEIGTVGKRLRDAPRHCRILSIRSGDLFVCLAP